MEAEAREAKRTVMITRGVWALISIGLVPGIADLAQVDINELAIPNLGLVIGLTGTLVSLFLMCGGKKYLRSITEGKFLNSTLVKSFIETAFVITWVFVGYMAYEMVVLSAGGGNYMLGEQAVESLLLAAGIASVFVIPGCGPQIIFVTLFAQGLVPFSALLANAISQDWGCAVPCDEARFGLRLSTGFLLWPWVYCFSG